MQIFRNCFKKNGIKTGDDQGGLMNIDDLIIQISKQDFDLTYFYNAILSDRILREAVVDQM
jgi:hypothetical protein